MSLSQFFRIVVLGIFCVLFMQASVEAPYGDISVFGIFQLVGGPIAILAIVPRKHWVRGFIGLAAFTGLMGLAFIASQFGRAWLDNQAVPYEPSQYLVHGLVSTGLLVAFGLWAVKHE